MTGHVDDLVFARWFLDPEIRQPPWRVRENAGRPRNRWGRRTRVSGSHEAIDPSGLRPRRNFFSAGPPVSEVMLARNIQGESIGVASETWGPLLSEMRPSGLPKPLLMKR